METLIGWFAIGIVYAIIVRVISKHGKKIWVLILFVILGPMGLIGLIVIFILFIINTIRERAKELEKELTDEQLKSRRKRRAIIVPITGFTLLLICILVYVLITNRSPLKIFSHLLKIISRLHSSLISIL